MPDGKTHLNLWKYGWMGAAPVAALITFTNPIIGISVIPGYLLGTILDPDLDIVGMTSSEGRMLKVPVLGWLLVGYWTIYGAAFRGKHRSFWTHGYIISTVIRYIWQFWPIAILAYKYSWDWYLLMQVFSGLFIGTCISDIIHTTADKLYGENKNDKRNRSNRY